MSWRSSARCRPRAAGFTLLELLLATMLAGGIIAVAYEMYLGSLRSARRGREEMALYQAARAVFETMTQDLRAAVLTRGVFGFGLRGSDGAEEQPAGDLLEVSCASLVPWREEPEGFDAPPLPPRADLRHVTYRVIPPEEALEEGTEPGITPTVGLVRQVRTNLTSRDADDYHQQIISRQVVALDCQYFDGLEWQDQWDAGAADRMPLAVRITVVVVPSGEDLLEGEAETAAAASVPETLAEMYPGARAFTTVIHLPTAVETGRVRIFR